MSSALDRPMQTSDCETSWKNRKNLLSSTSVMPMVSVFMMIYNHEKYLKDALEGILMQETDFFFNVVVGEDFSTDNSRNILLTYAERYPDRFKLILHPKNCGPHENQKIVFDNCDGRYIAFCEGDDYWTNPFKLQKQVDVLEANREVNVCFHPVSIIDEEGERSRITNENTPTRTGFTDLIPHNYIHTPSVMIRRASLPAVLPSWFHKLSVGDWPLLLLAASTGEIHKLNEAMAVYRVHATGIWSQNDEVDIAYKWGKNTLALYQYFDKKYHRQFLTSAANYFYKLLRHNIVFAGSFHKTTESIYLYYRTAPYRPLKKMLSPIKWLFNKRKS